MGDGVVWDDQIEYGWRAGGAISVRWEEMGAQIDVRGRAGTHQGQPAIDLPRATRSRHVPDTVPARGNNVPRGYKASLVAIDHCFLPPTPPTALSHALIDDAINSTHA